MSGRRGGSYPVPKCSDSLYSSSAVSRRLQTLELARCKANSRPGTVPCLPFRAVLLWLPEDLETVKISLWDKVTARWSGACGGGPQPPPRPARSPSPDGASTNVIMNLRCLSPIPTSFDPPCSISVQPLIPPLSPGSPPLSQAHHDVSTVSVSSQ